MSEEMHKDGTQKLAQELRRHLAFVLGMSPSIVQRCALLLFLNVKPCACMAMLHGMAPWT